MWAGLDVDDLGDELERAGGIDPRERRRRARLEREHVHAVVSLLRLVEQRAGERAIVADPRRGPGEAEERAAVLGGDGEDVLVRAGRAPGVAEQLLPEQRDLLEVRDASHGVVRLHRRLRVKLDERAHLAVERLGRGGGEEAREVIEDLGVPGRRDPRRAEVLHRVAGLAQHDLGDVGGLRERRRAPRPLLGPRRLRQPERHALLGPVRLVEQAIEELDERRDRSHPPRARAGRRRSPIELARLFPDHRQGAQLERDARGLGHELQPGSPRAPRLEPLSGRLVQGHELVEDAAVDRVDRRRARGGALEQKDRAGVVTQLQVGDAGGVELEARAPHRVGLDLRLFGERGAQLGGVAAGGQVTDVRRAHRPHARVELDRALERPPRGVDPPEPSLEDLRPLDVKPRRERRRGRRRLRPSARGAPPARRTPPRAAPLGSGRAARRGPYPEPPR